MSNDKHWTIGIHAVTALLQHRPTDVIRVRIQAGRKDARLREIQALCRKAHIPTEELNRRSMEQQHPGVHQGVAAEHQAAGPADTPRDERQLIPWLASLAHDPFLLVLDGVTDPHNLGACLRTADAAGVDAVIVPKDRSAPLSASVRKAASGAAETVPLVRVTNLARCLQALKEQGLWLAGTAEDAPTSLYEQNLTGPLALVMGSEGGGLRQLTRKHCDFLLSIPMAGSVGSLNISVAAGISLFEAARQRAQSR